MNYGHGAPKGRDIGDVFASVFDVLSRPYGAQNFYSAYPGRRTAFAVLPLGYLIPALWAAEKARNPEPDIQM